jgi:hypothetical protein
LTVLRRVLKVYYQKQGRNVKLSIAYAMLHYAQGSTVELHNDSGLIRVVPINGSVMDSKGLIGINQSI